MLHSLYPQGMIYLFIILPYLPYILSKVKTSDPSPIETYNLPRKVIIA